MNASGNIRRFLIHRIGTPDSTGATATATIKVHGHRGGSSIVKTPNATASFFQHYLYGAQPPLRGYSDATQVTLGNPVLAGTPSVKGILNLIDSPGIRKICLINGTGGDITDMDDHRCYAIGATPGDNGYIRLQLPTTTAGLRIFGATGQYLSNELITIEGAKITCGRSVVNFSDVLFDLNVTRTISASNGDRYKKIVVHEEGTATDPYDHRFHGLGVQPYQLRYQISSTVNNHVFYAATSATTSNELFRVLGTGGAACNGIMTARTLLADSWRAPTTQGAHVAWNRTNGDGRTTFANHQGGGYGGWEWMNYNANNTQTSPSPQMTLDRNGNLYVSGTVGSLNDQNNVTMSNFSWTYPHGTVVSSEMKLWKIGQIVTMCLGLCDSNDVAVSAGYLTWQGTLPSWAFVRTGLLGPNINFHAACTVTIDAWQRVAATIEITLDGKVIIQPNRPYNWSGRSGWNPISISYPGN